MGKRKKKEMLPLNSKIFLRQSAADSSIFYIFFFFLGVISDFRVSIQRAFKGSAPSACITFQTVFDNCVSHQEEPFRNKYKHLRRNSIQPCGSHL